VVGFAVLGPRARASTVDPKRMEIVVYEFQDTPQFAGLEACVVRHQPVTVVLPSKSLTDCTVPHWPTGSVWPSRGAWGGNTRASCASE
jgi:hypothetical protein